MIGTNNCNNINILATSHLPFNVGSRKGRWKSSKLLTMLLCIICTAFYSYSLLQTLLLIIQSLSLFHCLVSIYNITFNFVILFYLLHVISESFLLCLLLRPYLSWAKQILNLIKIVLLWHKLRFFPSSSCVLQVISYMI